MVMTGKTGDKVWERGMRVDFYEWAKNVKILASHMNIHEMVTS